MPRLHSTDAQDPPLGCPCATCRRRRAASTARAQAVAPVANAWWTEGYRKLERSISDTLSRRYAGEFDRAFLSGDSPHPVTRPHAGATHPVQGCSCDVCRTLPWVRTVAANIPVSDEMMRDAQPAWSWSTALNNSLGQGVASRVEPNEIYQAPPRRPGAWTRAPAPAPDPLPNCVDCGDVSRGRSATGVAFCDECAIDLDVEGWRPWTEPDIQWEPIIPQPASTNRPNVPGDWSWVQPTQIEPHVNQHLLGLGAANRPAEQAPEEYPREWTDGEIAASAARIAQIRRDWRDFWAEERIAAAVRRPENFANVITV